MQKLWRYATSCEPLCFLQTHLGFVFYAEGGRALRDLLNNSMNHTRERVQDFVQNAGQNALWQRYINLLHTYVSFEEKNDNYQHQLA